MTYLFISHSTQDRTLAHSLAERLENKGFRVFLDFSNKFGVAGGMEWERTIWDAIRKSAAVLLCCTPDIQSSQWAFAEVMIARYEGKRVFPLLFKGNQDIIWETLRASTQFIDFTQDPEQGYIRLFHALERAGYLTVNFQEIDVNRPPYAGLEALQKEDAPRFFARRRDADNIIAMLQPKPGGHRTKFLTIIGPSGSGKSSLVRAGVVPRLLKGAVQGSENWLYTVFTPSNNPYLRLAEALKRTAPQLGSIRTIENELRVDEKGLSYVISDALVLKPENSFLVLIIDQLEEITTRSNKEDITALFRAISTATSIEMNGTGCLICLATLRADFYPALLSINAASDILRSIYPLVPLNAESLRDVIEGPAQIAGIVFEDGLVQRMLDDAGTADALPLLSFVLRLMYDSSDRSSRIFTHAAYNKLGGLQGALGRHAEGTFSELDFETGNALLSTIIQYFVTMSQEGKATRRRVNRDEIPVEAIKGIDKFVGARLFTAGEDEGQPTVEVAHEAIFRNWDRLAKAIASETATIQYLRQVLSQGVFDRERLGVLLGNEQRELINQHKDVLKLDSSQLELIIRSSIRANDEAEYWFERGCRETTRIWSITKDILLKGDPISRYRLLELLENMIEQSRYVEPSTELIGLVTNSEYPAIRRYSQRIINRNKSIGLNESFVDTPIDFIRIEESECVIGEGDRQKVVNVDTYEISKYPITNLEFMAFVLATSYKQPVHWTANSEFAGKADHPVVYVSWFDAVAYCKWLSSVDVKYNYRLPSEIEWEKAASWSAVEQSKTVYPWGDFFDQDKCNSREAQIGDTTPIGQYSPHGGDSHYGISDASGNRHYRK